MDWVDEVTMKSLIEAVVDGADPAIVLDRARVGIPYRDGMQIRTFFDGYGDLRFCTKHDVLIDHNSNDQMMWLREVAANELEADNPLVDIFSDFAGDLDSLCRSVKSQ